MSAIKLKVLALIPARGGSRSIKLKNLKKINNISLVGHSINHALKSKLVDRVIVSSDNDKIIKETLKFGAEAPFKRPKEISRDDTLDFPVFEHCINWLKKNENWEPDIIVHLRPTCPFRKKGWIDNCVKELVNNEDAQAIRSVSLVKEHPYRMYEVNKKTNMLESYVKNVIAPATLRRQDHPKLYHYNCVIDVTRLNTLKKVRSMTGDNLIGWFMNNDEVIDIDTQADLDYARYFFKHNKI